MIVNGVKVAFANVCVKLNGLKNHGDQNLIKIRKFYRNLQKKSKAKTHNKLQIDRYLSL